MSRDKRGSIRIRDGKVYARVTWVDSQGNRREMLRLAENRTHAHQLKKQLIRELEEHGSKLVDAANMTFNDLAAFYEERYLVDPVYLDGEKVEGLRSKRSFRLNLHTLKEYFGRQKIRSITRGDLEKYKSTRRNTPRQRDGAKRSLAGVNRELALLRRMLNIAIEEGWLLKNPFSTGKSLVSTASERKRERIVSREEEARLLEACTGIRAHLKPILVCALDTGLRAGEIFKLVWADIDFGAGLINVRAFNTKTMQQRQVAMTVRLERELWQLYQDKKVKPDKLVFGILSCHKAFGTLRKSVGLDDVRFHDLRHTAATRMIQVGIPLQKVGRILGHTQAQTTFRYVNINANTARRVASALDALYLE